MTAHAPADRLQGATALFTPPCPVGERSRATCPDGCSPLHPTQFLLRLLTRLVNQSTPAGPSRLDTGIQSPAGRYFQNQPDQATLKTRKETPQHTMLH
ncbi:MAG: hypothetical protein HN675_11450 [Opitutae bacterium]|nr:hypothetical protein [Opitutae bacterium]